MIHKKKPHTENCKIFNKIINLFTTMYMPMIIDQYRDNDGYVAKNVHMLMP